jgi:hypothetical protein
VRWNCTPREPFDGTAVVDCLAEDGIIFSVTIAAVEEKRCGCRASAMGRQGVCRSLGRGKHACTSASSVQSNKSETAKHLR